MARGTVPLIVTSPVNGSVIAGATVTIQNYDGSAAVVYTSRTGTGNLGTNAVTTDANGALTNAGAEVWLNVGTYRFVISGSGLTTRTLIREIVSGDGMDEFIPVGAIVPYGGSAAPTGWLLCDGTLAAQASYPALFARIGHAYNGGADPGGGNFRLPNLQQRFPLGKATAGTGSTLGGTGGSIDHAHTVASHTHSVPSHYHGKGTLAITGSGGAHGHSGTTGTDSPDHTHNVDHVIDYNIGPSFALGSQGVGQNVIASQGANQRHTHTFSVSNQGTHTHPNGDFSGSVGNTGGSNGDSAMTSGAATPATDGNNPPFQVVNYIIRHGRQES